MVCKIPSGTPSPYGMTPGLSLTDTPEPTKTKTPSPTSTSPPTETPTITPTPTQTSTPTETIAPTRTPIEVPFDKSRPETIAAADGKKYEGYLIDDHYGTRLIDNLNNIILVKKEGSWRAPKSLNYSPEYPAVFYETKIGNADGFKIPVTLGLSRNVSQGKGFTYTEAHMTQLGADDTASMYLNASWARYRDVMNHPGTSYNKYLDLVRQGKGNIEVVDALIDSRVLVDPRQGFSVVITGNKQKEMPSTYYDTIGFYFSADEKGRILLATNTAQVYYLGSGVFGITEKNRWFVCNSINTVSWISGLPDKCFKGRIEKICGTPKIIGWDTLYPKYLSDYRDFYYHKSSDPLFTLR